MLYCFSPESVKYAEAYRVDQDCQPTDLILVPYGNQSMSPFVMDMEAASLLSGAILLVWASAYAIRVLVKTLDAGSPE